MKFGRTRPMFWATAGAIVCLLGAVSARVTAQQATPAQPHSQTADEVFKNIQVFKGVPVDTSST